MDIFNLAYENNGEKVYFSSLHFQGVGTQREMIFKFIWRKDRRPSNLYDPENGVDEKITNIDHITFHKNGEVVISYYKPKKCHYFERKTPTPIGTVPGNYYAPLLIYSINNLNGFKSYLGRSSIFDSGENVADLSWKVHNEPFSIGIFVMSNKLEPQMLEMNFPGIFKVEDTAWFPFTVNKDTGLLLAFSKKLVLPDDDKFKNPKYKNKSYKVEEVPTLGIRLVPSDERIRQLR